MSDPSRPKPFSPRGVVDGSVADEECIRNMSFVMKYGSSCDVPFYAKDFCNKHRQWKDLEPYLMDRPVQPWTLFSSGMKPKSIKIYTNQLRRDIPSIKKTRKTQIKSNNRSFKQKSRITF